MTFKTTFFTMKAKTIIIIGLLSVFAGGCGFSCGHHGTTRLMVQSKKSGNTPPVATDSLILPVTLPPATTGFSFLTG
jgi:hypothetical protein